VITFDDDDIEIGVSKDDTIYGGFNWTNFFYHDTRGPNTSFKAGLKSENNVGYNHFGNPASFASTTAFTVNSLWATAGWRSGMNVTFLGYNQSGQLVQSRTVTPSASEPRLYVFDWVGLYKFGFSASGGTAVGSSDGTQVVLDDITVNGTLRAVTEPDYTPPPPPSPPITDPGTDPSTDPGTDQGTEEGTEEGTNPGTDLDPGSPPLVVDLPTTPPPGGPADLPSTTQTGAVPSPATFMLLGLGLLGLGAARYKRTLDRQSDCAQGK
jgi:hypothetical protein